MRHKVGADDFKRAGRLLKQQEETGMWWVCEEYELSADSVVAKHPAPGEEARGQWRHYRPLEEVPDLVLKFARLFDQTNFERAALEWSNRYGLPGTTEHTEGNRLDETSHFVESMTLSRFRHEVEWLRAIIQKYEAVLNGVEDMGVRQYVAGGGSEAASLEVTLFMTMHMVTGRVRQLCHPVLVLASDERNPHDRSDPSGVKSAWGFDNLLGAMYLQMYWLMASGGELARCEYCRRTISLARPHPEGRKPPKHKRFCDAACRQANHRSKKES